MTIEYLRVFFRNKGHKNGEKLVPLKKFLIESNKNGEFLKKIKETLIYKNIENARTDMIEKLYQRHNLKFEPKEPKDKTRFGPSKKQQDFFSLNLIPEHSIHLGITDWAWKMYYHRVNDIKKLTNLNCAIKSGTDASSRLQEWALKTNVFDSPMDVYGFNYYTLIGANEYAPKDPLEALKERSQDPQQ